MHALDWFWVNVICIESGLRGQLAEQWMPFARGKARKQWLRVGGDLDDWTDIAYLATVQAARKFDPAHGNGFGAYLGRAIHNHFVRELIAPVQSLTGDDGTQLDIADPNSIDPSDPPEEQPDLSDGMQRALRLIDAREREVVQRCCVEGASFTAVASELGLTAAGVAGLYERALTKLRTRLEHPERFAEQGELWVESA